MFGFWLHFQLKFLCQSVNKAPFSVLLKGLIYLSPLFDFLDLIIINLFNFVFTSLISIYKNKSVKYTAK